jgi:hypothetical protein
MVRNDGVSVALKCHNGELIFYYGNICLQRS